MNFLTYLFLIGYEEAHYHLLLMPTLWSDHYVQYWTRVALPVSCSRLGGYYNHGKAPCIHDLVHKGEYVLCTFHTWLVPESGETRSPITNMVLLGPQVFGACWIRGWASIYGIHVCWRNPKLCFRLQQQWCSKLLVISSSKFSWVS